MVCMRIVLFSKRFISYLRTYGLRKTLFKTSHFFLKRFFIPISEFQTVKYELEKVNNDLKDLMQNNFESNFFIAKWMGNNPYLIKTERSISQPLISIIMPTFNRGFIIENAIKSVLSQIYKNWELLIIDNGSTDNTDSVLNKYLSDKRIFYFSCEQKENVSSARNLGLSKSRGEIIAYHDTDINWYPHFLNILAIQFEKNPEKDCCYLGQFVVSLIDNKSFFRFRNFSRNELEQNNFIDLNVFAHRRTLWLELGGFDENLWRLTDWDLILRYTKYKDPICLNDLGGNYFMGSWPRISDRDSYSYHHYLLKRKHEKVLSEKISVLYVLFHYPQLTESYIETEILYMRKRGFDIQVWSQLDIPTAAQYQPEVKVFYGDLEEIIKKVKPNLIHLHWLNTAWQFHDVFSKFKIPVTVRGHGFETNYDTIKNLQAHSSYLSIYLFPHFYQMAALENKIKLLPYNSAFDPILFYPKNNKNKKLVLRTGCALHTKDYETYFQTAKKCPSFKFILALGKAQFREFVLDEMIARNRALGTPVEIMINVPRFKIAELMRSAAIYLHTHHYETPYGMPISIAEALATGCYVVAKKFPSTENYVGTSGDMYTTVDEAVDLVKATEKWTDDMWQAQQKMAIDYAYSRYVDSIALKPILDDWLEILKKTNAKSKSKMIEVNVDAAIL